MTLARYFFYTFCGPALIVKFCSTKLDAKVAHLRYPLSSQKKGRRISAHESRLNLHWSSSLIGPVLVTSNQKTLTNQLKQGSILSCNRLQGTLTNNAVNKQTRASRQDGCASTSVVGARDPVELVGVDDVSSLVIPYPERIRHAGALSSRWNLRKGWNKPQSKSKTTKKNAIGAHPPQPIWVLFLIRYARADVG